MRLDEMISMRLPADILRRAELLVPSLRHDRRYNLAGKITRSLTLRIALLEGLASLT